MPHGTAQWLPMMTKNLSNHAKPWVLLSALTLTASLVAGCQSIRTGAHSHPTTKSEQQALTPAAAQARLQAGNERYVSGQPLQRDWKKLRTDTAGGQSPYAVVLSCIDSRTSAEVVFDQGHGDIFSARIAGNVLNDDLLGSMEFACQVAGARFIAVVGHTGCGAVMGACNGAQLGHLTGLLEKIQPAVAEARRETGLATGTDARLVEAATKANVRAVVQQIRDRSPVLRKLADAGQLHVAGGVQDLASGRVEFFTP